MSVHEFPCPSCRRVNPVDSEGREAARCPRCGCELKMLVRIREAADARVRKARAALAGGFYLDAAHAAAESWSLRASAEAAGCAFLGELLQGNLARAARWNRRLNTVTEAEIRPPAS